MSEPAYHFMGVPVYYSQSHLATDALVSNLTHKVLANKGIDGVLSACQALNGEPTEIHTREGSSFDVEARAMATVKQPPSLFAETMKMAATEAQAAFDRELFHAIITPTDGNLTLGPTVNVWHKALSPEEVKAEYDKGIEDQADLFSFPLFRLEDGTVFVLKGSKATMQGKIHICADWAGDEFIQGYAVSNPHRWMVHELSDDPWSEYRDIWVRFKDGRHEYSFEGACWEPCVDERAPKPIEYTFSTSLPDLDDPGTCVMRFDTQPRYPDDDRVMVRLPGTDNRQFETTAGQAARIQAALDGCETDEERAAVFKAIEDFHADPSPFLSLDDAIGAAVGAVRLPRQYDDTLLRDAIELHRRVDANGLYDDYRDHELRERMQKLEQGE